MKVAIVGAGLAGIGVSYYLAQYSGMEITLFDAKGIGAGASGASTGLLHPFPGRRALYSWKGWEGMRETEHLLDLAEKSLGVPIAEKTGVFRPAITQQQQRDFQGCQGGEWQESSPFGPGLWIKDGITVYSRLYLQGLWKACQMLGVQLVIEKVHSLDALHGFDRIVLAAGHENLYFNACQHFPLKTTKGQTLLCRSSEKLPFSLVSQGHITPTEDPHLCQVGSTYERVWSSPQPDPLIAKQLLEKVAKFYAPAKDWPVLEIRSGVRIARVQGYQPLVQKVDPKTWIFTALGSRGMLYHALFGKALGWAVVHDSCTNLNHL